MKEKLKQYAKELHISDTGVCEARVYPELYDILASYDTPFTAPPAQRVSPFDFVPEAKSIIMCAFNYFSGRTPGNVSKYARGLDYHTVVKEKLAALCARLEADFGTFARYIFCDTSPLCDKYLAYQAGLGIFGRNHLLIHPVYGSYIFLGGIVTDLPLTADTPLEGGCAGCGRCAASCPGHAFDSGFDAARCASYLLQKKGALSEEEQAVVRRAGMAWGCDVCSDVCPHNQSVPITDIDEFRPTLYGLCPDNLRSDMAFRTAYGSHAFAWRGRKTLLRNVEIVKKK